MKVVITSGRLTAEIDSFGAELASVRDSAGREYLWQGNPRYWDRRAPVLFPFIGLLPGNRFIYEGREYPMGNHGFARDMEFELVENAPGRAAFRLHSNDRTLKLFPLDFTLEIAYTLEENRLTTAYRVGNPGKKTLRFFLGGHPGIVCPIAEGERFEDYAIIFEKPETIPYPRFIPGQPDNVLENEAVLPLTHALFDRGAFMKAHPRSQSVTLKSAKSGKFVRLDYAGFDCIAVWSQKGDAPFVCLEPWSSLPTNCDSSQDLSLMKLAVTLEPGDEYRRSFVLTYGV